MTATKSVSRSSDMSPKQFFAEYPTPYKKKGWPDDMKSYVQTFDTMDAWWGCSTNPRHLVLVLKTLNYAEEIWSWPIAKWGLACRDFYKREEASETCCGRIRRKIPVMKWHRTKNG